MIAFFDFSQHKIIFHRKSLYWLMITLAPLTKHNWSNDSIQYSAPIPLVPVASIYK